MSSPSPSARYFIGLLSGTSADCVDGALIAFEDESFDLVAVHAEPIDEATRNLVHQLATPAFDEINSLKFLDHNFAELFSKTVYALCKKTSMDHIEITAIGCHGQTVRHYPPKDDQLGYSLQIGDPNIISEQTGITTIADFRRRDIAAGGHGAPLAPGFHDAFFRSKHSDRIILNLGGIANITHLPVNGETIGFDTGPANALMDSWCQLHLNKPYDKNGAWAQSGSVHAPLLETFLQHHFFSKPYPKSTGREDFNLDWLQRLLEDFAPIQAQDVQSTLLRLTVTSVSNAITTLDPLTSAEVYVCGGGQNNAFLIDQLGQTLKPRIVTSTTELGLDPDWVEAATFAWLAKQTCDGKPGNLPRVTGAKRNVALGAYFTGEPTG